MAALGIRRELEYGSSIAMPPLGGQELYPPEAHLGCGIARRCTAIDIRTMLTARPETQAPSHFRSCVSWCVYFAENQRVIFALAAGLWQPLSRCLPRIVIRGRASVSSRPVPDVQA
jgi:hypothetical protein